MVNSLKILGVFLVIIWMGTGAYISISSLIDLNNISHDKTVPCYDRWDNLIVGTTCIETTEDQLEGVIISFIVGIFFIILAGIFVYFQKDMGYEI